jgi:hypothetical protein
MNSAGNALLNATNSVNGTVASAVSNVQNAAGGYGMIFLGIGIVLLIALGYMLYTQQTTIVNLIPGFGPPPPRDWREMERREAREERREAREERREERAAGFGENWCFVGEDVTGRWCVKVPRPDACTPERLFSSRPGCELVPASPLPLGLIAKGGAEMKPMLADLHTK